MEQKIDAVKWSRDLKLKLYEEWRKDPLAFEKKEKEHKENFKKKYIVKAKKTA